MDVGIFEQRGAAIAHGERGFGDARGRIRIAAAETGGGHSFLPEHLDVGNAMGFGDFLQSAGNGVGHDGMLGVVALSVGKAQNGNRDIGEILRPRRLPIGLRSRQLGRTAMDRIRFRDGHPVGHPNRSDGLPRGIAEPDGDHGGNGHREIADIGSVGGIFQQHRAHDAIAQSYRDRQQRPAAERLHDSAIDLRQTAVGGTVAGGDRFAHQQRRAELRDFLPREFHTLGMAVARQLEHVRAAQRAAGGQTPEAGPAGAGRRAQGFGQTWRRGAVGPKQAGLGRQPPERSTLSGDQHPPFPRQPAGTIRPDALADQQDRQHQRHPDDHRRHRQSGAIMRGQKAGELFRWHDDDQLPVDAGDPQRLHHGHDAAAADIQDAMPSPFDPVVVPGRRQQRLVDMGGGGDWAAGAVDDRGLPGLADRQRRQKTR